MNNDSDFYIGWQDKAPPLFARPLRWVVVGLFILVPMLAAVLVWQQRGFSDGLFEYGQLTTVQGQLIREPVPFLRVPVDAKAGAPPTFERLLLIGLGKHGADATLHQWETTHGPLTGKTLTIRGTRIHYDGQTAFELTEQAAALLTVSVPATRTDVPGLALLGTVTLQGEITDPKCFLGVMKPGDGRPHRSCAVRCIAGGIPPLLYATNARGESGGYVLVGANGERINDQLLEYVGKSVQVRGQLHRADNWLILRIDSPVMVVQNGPNLTGTIALCR